MREVELKAVLDDWEACSARLVVAGAVLDFAGRLEDRRYDTPDRTLLAHDVVLRVRTYRDTRGDRGELNWKGPTTLEGGFKVRDEIGTTVGDPAALVTMLDRLGYVVTLEMDRMVAVFAFDGAVVRLERYPRMDDLIEVEGEPDAIERAIRTLALDRASFSPERLPAFVERYERRTGATAALSDAELAGGPSQHFENA